MKRLISSVILSHCRGILSFRCELETSIIQFSYCASWTYQIVNLNHQMALKKNFYAYTWCTLISKTDYSEAKCVICVIILNLIDVGDNLNRSTSTSTLNKDQHLITPQRKSLWHRFLIAFVEILQYPDFSINFFSFLQICYFFVRRFDSFLALTGL